MLPAVSPALQAGCDRETTFSWKKTTTLPGHANPWPCSISLPPLMCSLWLTDAPLFIPQRGIWSPDAAENGLGQSQRAKKRIPRLRVSEKSLPWTLPQYLWQDRYWFHFSHSVYKLESNQNTVTCYKFCFALLQWLPVETVQALNRKR